MNRAAERMQEGDRHVDGCLNLRTVFGPTRLTPF